MQAVIYGFLLPEYMEAVVGWDTSRLRDAPLCGFPRQVACNYSNVTHDTRLDMRLCPLSESSNSSVLLHYELRAPLNGHSPIGHVLVAPRPAI